MVTKLSAPARVIVHDLDLYQSENSSNDGDDIVDDKNHALNGNDRVSFALLDKLAIDKYSNK